VIPAHNEERVIARTLGRLSVGVSRDDLDVVVVCNGCTDRTAEVARTVAPWARVLEVPKPSKAEAVRTGNVAGTVFPRVHLDADVVISGADVLNLVRPLREPGVLATAPQRVLLRDRSSRLVRWFYDVWEQLPQVRSGLFGRGVVAVSEEGQRRVNALPQLMSDDLGISEAFEPDERRVVWTAFAEVRAPGTFRDLIRRRVRVATAEPTTSGDDRIERFGRKWISPSQMPSSPHSSAASTVWSSSPKKSGSVAPVRSSSRNSPMCRIAPPAEGGVIGPRCRGPSYGKREAGR